MLPNTLPRLRTATTAALAALSLAAATAAPVQAGQRERDFLKGVAATVIVGTVLNNLNNRAQAQPRYFTPPRAQPQPQYYAPHTPHQPSYFAQPSRPGISSTVAAQAFKSYSPTERRAIQRQLARQGYYSGSIDGVFGPATFRAVASYAADRGLGGRIDSASGAYTVYDSLIY
jgi:hypothetical protein